MSEHTPNGRLIRKHADPQTPSASQPEKNHVCRVLYQNCRLNLSPTSQTGVVFRTRIATRILSRAGSQLVWTVVSRGRRPGVLVSRPVISLVWEAHTRDGGREQPPILKKEYDI